MPSLIEEIEKLSKSPGRLWFPGLAAKLAAHWSCLSPVVSADAYGTHRWLRGDPGAASDVRGMITIAGRTTGVEVLPPVTAGMFPQLRMVRDPDTAVSAILASAVGLLSRDLGLEESIGSLVRSIHVLRTDPGYDTSHSDPSIPFSIFVSVPTENERDVVFRVAESVLHEAMHLQLTLMEKSVPMVTCGSQGYSPWQRRERPVQGLLHGLYVFAVIHQFASCLAALDETLRVAAQRRCGEIAEEVSELDDFAPALSETGRNLRSGCLTSIFRNAAAT